jgi:3-hydroxyisobutyrate dehydrogenase-like beta-hydroxyacid dehydrogenase
MGERMARRLVASGYYVTVYDRDRARAHPLEEVGARFAPSRLAATVDVVLSSLTDDAAVEDVMFGPGGALDVARRGTTFIEMSTVSSWVSNRLHKVGAKLGLRMLDAPVSGTTPQAEAGHLVILAGGQEAVFSTCLPVLSALGSPFYMGPAGAGATTKLCLNTLLGLGIQALAEAIALGLRSGLDQERLLQILGETTVLSPSQKSKLELARSGDFAATFPLRLMHKDFGLISERAHELSVPMPSTLAAAQVCAIAHAGQATRTDEDFSVVIRTVQQLAGVTQRVARPEVAA